jgi:predicted thioredoxin/glutaredoxin
LGFRKSENSIGFQEVRELYWVSGSKRTLLGFRKLENSIGFQEVRELYWVSGSKRVLLLPETQ